MKKNLKACLAFCCIIALAGCAKTGNTDGTNNAADESTTATVNYQSSAEVLETVWNGLSEDNKFPAYGGDQTAPVDGAPGKVDVSNTDVLTYSLLIPEASQNSVTDVATLMHYINPNSFTGATVKVASNQQDDFTSQLKSHILSSQFICGFPERLVILSTGDYVIYAFGAEDIIASFEDAAMANVKDIKLIAQEAFDAPEF